MASLQDIGVSAAINILSAFAFLVAFALLRLQPINDRVYFPKWYLKGIRGSPTRSGALVSKFVNMDFKTYFKFLNWMPAALSMPEAEITDHAGLDSAVFIRIYLLGLKIFIPITLLAFVVLVPVNWTGKTLEGIKNLTYSNIDKLSISNVPSGSNRSIGNVGRFTISEYDKLSCYFQVLVKNVPPDPDESISEHVEHFFCVNHPEHYLLHQVVYNANYLAKLVAKKKRLHNWLVYYQNKHERNPAQRPTTKTGLWGLWGNRVDAIGYYTAEIEKLTLEMHNGISLAQENVERERVTSDPKAKVPAAFVSFKTRWGAAVCAQTQQSSNPTIWLTEWAPEPRDVYWDNLAIPYVELSIRRLLMSVGLFFLIFFFMIPIAFVQSLANIEGIMKVLPFLKPLIEKKVVKSFIQGFLPGIALKIFLILLPTILMTMSRIEGFASLSSLERRSAEKYHMFIFVNVFLGSIVTGTAFQQLEKFVNEPSTEFTKTIGVSIPMKATFFMTYIMVDGWAGIAAEILRLVPLVMFHLKNTFLVKTEEDRERAMDPGCLDFATSEPRIQFYFLLGLVYSVITPVLLPFIVVFFAFSFMVFRHQVINVYDQKYESAAAFWPHVHRRVITGLIVAQLLLMGLFSTKGLAKSTSLLIAQPILTIWFHRFCKGRFESAFLKFPLQDAMVKDTLERATEPNLNLRTYLKDAYVHPVFKGGELERPVAMDEEESSPLVATKRKSSRSSRHDSETGSEAGVH
ncbi:hypothetical protein TIFTF001_017927 [Ficus carica]|uniref:CSC1-like protein At4g02900 n=1 Tax=Ficus carica TaxID=3494 RepID=A0AA88AM44_FICCA|nr:hypothetical protein TIFTF001_017927 [Ficus carica]